MRVSVIVNSHDKPTETREKPCQQSFTEQLTRQVGILLLYVARIKQFE